MTPSELRASPVLVLDLETTGYSADHDRAIEVAALRYEGETLVDSFESLLNPRMPVSPRIQRLTGITEAMVEQAPTLEEVMPQLIELIEGAVLVAHNLPFDFGFLRRAAATARLEIKASRLCTLKLARRLMPELESHSLDALMDSLGLEANDGRRALSHALQTALLYRRLVPQADDATLVSCIDKGVRTDRAPRDPELWKGLPTGAGVYLLKDANGRVIYVGKSMHLRRRVQEHLRHRWHPQARLRREMRRVRQVDVIETETDLEALFLESRLIKRYQPKGNSAERLERFSAYLTVDRAAAWPMLRVVDAFQDHVACVYGPFGSRGMLEAGLRALSDAVGLCAFGDPARCRPSIPRHCIGPCGLNRKPSQYRDAVESALSLLRGEDQGLLDYLRERRDHEADGLNFEAAAALRDRIFALERLVGDGRWLQDCRAVNVVLLLPAERTELRKLVCIRENRLAGTHRLNVSIEPTDVASILDATFLSADLPIASHNEVAEEMRLVHQWLRRARARHPVISVDTTRVADAAEMIVSTLRNPESSVFVR